MKIHPKSFFDYLHLSAKNIILVIVFLSYAFNAWHLNPNSDERASVVIALGTHPPLVNNNGTAITQKDYLEALEYKRYSVSEIKIANTIQSTINDNTNGLIYYLLLSALIKLLGLNLFHLRLLSILFTIVNLNLIYRIAKEFRIHESLCLLLLLQISFNPVFAQDAVLIRSYMLALTGCLICILSLYKIVATGSSEQQLVLTYFLGFILAAGSHYATVYVLTGLSIYLLLANRNQMRTAFIYGYMVIFLLGVLWFWRVYPDGLSNLGFLVRKSAQNAVGTGYEIVPANFLRQMLLYGVSVFGNQFMINPGGVIFKGISMILMFVLIGRLLIKRNDFTYQFVSSITILPLVFFIIESLITKNFSNFIPHYLVFFIPGWCVLLYLVIDNHTGVFNLKKEFEG